MFSKAPLRRDGAQVLQAAIANAENNHQLDGSTKLYVAEAPCRSVDSYASFSCPRPRPVGGHREAVQPSHGHRARARVGGHSGKKSA